MASEDPRWNLNVHYHRVALDAIPKGARTALDVGCGDGLLTFDIADRGLLVTGLDAIVGFARPSGFGDRARAIAGMALKRSAQLRGRYWEHQAPVAWPPPLASSEMADLVDRELPGARFRNVLSNRYTAIWTRPFG